MATITVDGRKIEAEPGANLLRVCLDNGIYIPHLCYLEQRPAPAASCRLCFVAIEGEKRPAASCTVVVSDGMIVETGAEEVRRLQRAGLEMLLSVHDVSCKTCPANRKCGLQDIARFLKVGLKSKRLPRRLRKDPAAFEHPLVDYEPNRCVLCGKCVEVCRLNSGLPRLAFSGRGFETRVTAFGAEAPECDACGVCIDVCPVGALFLR